MNLPTKVKLPFKWILPVVAVLILAAIAWIARSPRPTGNAPRADVSPQPSGSAPTPSPTLPLEPYSLNARSIPYLSPVSSIGRGLAQAVAWSPNGKTIAVASTFGLYLYDAEAMLPAATLGRENCFERLAFSADSKLLAATSCDFAVWVWDLSQQTLLHTFEGHQDSVTALAFDSDNSRLASASPKSGIWVWEPASGKLLETIKMMETVNGLAFSPKTHDLAVVSTKKLRLFSFPYGLPETYDDVGGVMLQAVAYSPDGDRVLSASLRSQGSAKWGQLTAWDAGSGTLTQQEDLIINGAHHSVFSADGSWLVSSDVAHNIWVWETTQPQPATILNGRGETITALGINPNGTKVIAILENRELTLWDVLAKRSSATLAIFTDPIDMLAVSRDGRLLASLNSRGTVQLWDWTQGSQIGEIPAFSRAAGESPIAPRLQLSPDGRTLAWEFGDEVVRVWDTKTLEQQTTFSWKSRTIERVAFHPFDPLIATGQGHTMELWYADPFSTAQIELETTGTPWLFENMTGGEISHIIYSPDGGVLVTSGEYVERWDARTGHSLDFGIADQIPGKQTTYSPNSLLLAVLNRGQVELRDAASMDLVTVIQSTHGGIYQMVFNPEGDLLTTLSKSSDKKASFVEFWDPSSGQLLFTLPQTATPVTCMVFTPDGYEFITGSAGGVIQRWQVLQAPFAVQTPPPTPTRVPTNSTKPAPISTPTPKPAPTATLPPLHITDLGILGMGNIAASDLSLDGNLLAVGTLENVLIYDAHSLKLLHTFEYPDVRDLYFSPDGIQLLVGYVDNYNSFNEILNIETGTTVSLSLGLVEKATFSADGQHLAILTIIHALNSYDIEVYRTSDGILEQEIRSPDDAWSFSGLSSNIDGSLMAAGGRDLKVYVLETETGEPRNILEGHAALINATAFSPDGKLLASGSADGSVRLWNLTNEQTVRILHFANDITGVSFSADGRQLHVQIKNGAEQVHDVSTGKLLDIPSESITDLLDRLQLAENMGKRFNAKALGPDPQLMSHFSGEKIYLWDIAERKLRDIIDLHILARTLPPVYAADGKRLFLVKDKQILIFDMQSRQWLSSLTLEGHYDITDMVVSQDGRKVAILQEGRIVLLDAVTGQRLPGAIVDEEVEAVAFSDDGDSLVSLSWNDTRKDTEKHKVDVWQIATGQRQASFYLSEFFYGSNLVLAVHKNWVYITWEEVDSPADDLHAVGGVWDLSTGLQVSSLRSRDGNSLVTVILDGQILIAYNYHELQFWDARSGQPIYSQPFGLYMEQMPKLSPDGHTLVWSDSFGQLHLWDLGPTLDILAQRYTPAGIPVPTPAPSAVQTPTAVSMPPNQITFQPSAHVGRGIVGQMHWSQDEQKLIVPSAWGIYTYTATTLADQGSLETADPLDSLGYEKDGSQWGAGSQGNTITLWDLTTRQVVQQYTGQGPALLSPDGHWLLYRSAMEDDVLQIWDVQTGQAGVQLRGITHDAAIAFSSNSNQVATGNDRHVRVWDIASGEIVAAFDTLLTRPSALAFSPDGARLAVGDRKAAVRIWEIGNSQLVSTIRLSEIDPDEFRVLDNDMYFESPTWAASMGFSSDGKRLAIGTNDGVLQLASVPEGKIIWRNTALPASICQVLFHPNGRNLAVVTANSTLSLWNVQTGVRLATRQEHASGFNGLQFQNDGSLAAWHDTALWFADPNAGEIVQISDTFSGTIYAVSHDSRLLLVHRPPETQLWQIQTTQTVFSQTLQGGPVEFQFFLWRSFDEYGEPGIEMLINRMSAAVFSLDDQIVAAAGSGGVWKWERFDQSLNSVPGAKFLLNLLLGDEFYVNNFALSLDGKWAAGQSYRGGPLLLWEAPPRVNIAKEIPLLGNLTSSLVFSSSGKMLAGCQRDGFFVWATDTREILRRTPLAEGCTALAFSPDERLIFIGDRHGAIQILDVASGLFYFLPSKHRGAITHLVLSPDGLHLASAGGDGVLWIYALPEP